MPIDGISRLVAVKPEIHYLAIGSGGTRAYRRDSLEIVHASIEDARHQKSSCCAAALPLARGVAGDGWAGDRVLICGTAINAAFDQGVRRIDPRYTALSGTCYFAGDARHYMRIALNGYSDYDPALMPLHYSQPNDRGWWPLFPALAAGARARRRECSGLIVNGWRSCCSCRSSRR